MKIARAYAMQQILDEMPTRARHLQVKVQPIWDCFRMKKCQSSSYVSPMIRIVCPEVERAVTRTESMCRMTAPFQAVTIANLREAEKPVLQSGMPIPWSKSIFLRDPAPALVLLILCIMCRVFQSIRLISGITY